MSNESEPKNETNEFDDLFHKSIYTPQEAAELANVNIDVIYQAVHRGTLKAVVVGHDVISIGRGDLVHWMTIR